MTDPYPEQAAAVPQEPSNGIMVWAILAMVLTSCMCCNPFGIPALIYAGLWMGYVKSGNWQAAEEAYKNAKLWCIVTTVAGALYYLVMAAFYIFYFAAFAAMMGQGASGF